MPGLAASNSSMMPRKAPDGSSGAHHCMNSMVVCAETLDVPSEHIAINGTAHRASHRPNFLVLVFVAIAHIFRTPSPQRVLTRRSQGAVPSERSQRLRPPGRCQTLHGVLRPAKLRHRDSVASFSARSRLSASRLGGAAERTYRRRGRRRDASVSADAEQFVQLVVTDTPRCCDDRIPASPIASASAFDVGLVTWRFAVTSCRALGSTYMMPSRSSGGLRSRRRAGCASSLDLSFLAENRPR